MYSKTDNLHVSEKQQPGLHFSNFESCSPLGEKFDFQYFGMYNLKQSIAKPQKSDSWSRNSKVLLTVSLFSALKVRQKDCCLPFLDIRV